MFHIVYSLAVSHEIEYFYFLKNKKFLSFTFWYTVKLARAKLPANAGNFTCSSQVKRPHTQFTCVTCGLLVKTGKFTCVEAASTSRIHANCLQVHAYLPNYQRHFTGNFTCGTHAILPATSMQNCLLLQAKLHATYRQKHYNLRWKYPPNAGKNNCKRREKDPHNRRQKTCNSTHNYQQMQAICYHTAGKFTCKLQVS